MNRWRIVAVVVALALIGLIWYEHTRPEPLPPYPGTTANPIKFPRGGESLGARIAGSGDHPALYPDRFPPGRRGLVITVSLGFAIQ